MMHLKLLLRVAAVISLFSSVCFAQQSVAIVDFERAVVGSAKGQEAEKKFQAKYDEKNAEIQKKQKEIDDLQSQLTTQQRVLSDARKAEITRDIGRKSTDLDRMKQDADRELQELRQELLGPIVEIGRRVLNGYVAQKGYDFVFDISQQDNNIIWYNKKNDITDDLIKQIDAAIAAATTTTPASPGATP